MNRNDRLDPAFDPRIVDWLETDPDRAPGEVIDTILAALPSIPQRRAVLGRPWRFPLMPTTAKLAVTAMAIVAVGLVGFSLLKGPAVGPAASPPPTTSPSPATPPPLTERFDSALHGISVSYPAGWQTKPATEPWVHGALAFDSSEVDVIFDPTLQDAVYIAIVSEPLDGQRPDDWCCSPSVEYPDVCEPGSGGHGAGTSTLDGAKSWFVTSGCIRHGRRGDSHSIFAATATRGYIVTLYVLDASLGANYDVDWFTSVLETVELHPESAR
jgi:hypothetical protein